VDRGQSPGNRVLENRISHRPSAEPEIFVIVLQAEENRDSYEFLGRRPGAREKA